MSPPCGPAAHRTENAVGRRTCCPAERTDLLSPAFLAARLPLARALHDHFRSRDRADRPSRGRSRSGPQFARPGWRSAVSTRTSIGVLGSSARKSLESGSRWPMATDAVKDALGAPIPELAMIEDSVDHSVELLRGSTAAGVHRANEKARADRLRSRGSGLPCEATTSLLSVADRVHRHARDWRAGSTGRSRLLVENSAPRRPKSRGLGRARASGPGLSWFFDRGSAPGAEMATRAGLHTVTPHLHIPEKGFAEGARHGGIPDEVV